MVAMRWATLTPPHACAFTESRADSIVSKKKFNRTAHVATAEGIFCIQRCSPFFTSRGDMLAGLRVGVRKVHDA